MLNKICNKLLYEKISGVEKAKKIAGADPNLLKLTTNFSVSDPEPDPDSGVFWIRIQNPDPDPGA